MSIVRLDTTAIAALLRMRHTIPIEPYSDRSLTDTMDLSSADHSNALNDNQPLQLFTRRHRNFRPFVRRWNKVGALFSHRNTSGMQTIQDGLLCNAQPRCDLDRVQSFSKIELTQQRFIDSYLARVVFTSPRIRACLHTKALPRVDRVKHLLTPWARPELPSPGLPWLAACGNEDIQIGASNIPTVFAARCGKVAFFDMLAHATRRNAQNRGNLFDREVAFARAIGHAGFAVWYHENVRTSQLGFDQAPAC